MNTFKEHDLVKTIAEHKIAERTLPAGQMGTIISVHPDGWYDVEFPYPSPTDPFIISLHRNGLIAMKSITVVVPAEIADKVEAQATAEGKTTEAYVAKLVEDGINEKPKFGSWSIEDFKTHAEQLREDSDMEFTDDMIQTAFAEGENEFDASIGFTWDDVDRLLRQAHKDAVDLGTHTPKSE